MNNYITAQQVLNNRASRKIGNNTYLKRLDADTIGVLLHETFVVKYTPKYTELNSGGWRTNTTKDRINTYAPVRISQRNSIWYIGDFLYYDGIQIADNGDILSEKRIPEATEKKTAKLKSKIKSFIDYAVKQVLAGKVGVPSGGDCWHCVLKTEDGETLGDSFQNIDHLLGHIKEKYVVPALLWNAIKEAGYKWPEIILGYDRATMKTSHNAFEFGVRNSLRKYLTKRLLRDILK